MISKRIKTIASLLDSDDTILDVGTDHALLPIYLIKNNIVNIADGSDISENVLINAKENVSKNNLNRRINLFLSDGVKAVDISKYNVLVIAGMGFNTIKNILDNANLKNIQKLIIQTNNDYAEFRKYIIEKDFKIESEICLKDKKINYIIFKLSKGSQELSNEEINCGIYCENNKWFYKENINSLRRILKNIPSNNEDKINQINYLISVYDSYISK